MLLQKIEQLENHQRYIKTGVVYHVTKEMIEETYSVQELEEHKRQLKKFLQSEDLTEEEKWELNDLLDTVNKRIRLMSELLIECPVVY